MTAENIVINILIAVSSTGLLFIAAIFNIKLPPLFKDFKKKPEKAFVIAAFVICDILILCALFLTINGIIGKL